MSKKAIHAQHSFLFFVVLLALLFVVVGLVFFGAISIAFKNVGFTPLTIFLLLIATLLGSFINIPVLKLKANVPMVRDETVNWFGVTYRIPQVEYGETVTTVAVNVGGALVPTGVCMYLLLKSAASMIFLSFIGVFVVALITHLIARPVKGVGITTPMFVPPIVAAVTAVLLSPAHPIVIAYVSGVLGALIGADLLNLRKIPDLGAPMASIGGAGTFDGVFLTGIIAVLVAGL
jgi:uncharacterized membrane protein